MSFFGDTVENMKRAIGWKGGTTDRGWKAYNALPPTGPYDFGHEPTMLSRRAFRRLPQSKKKSIITEARSYTALGG